MSAKQTSKPAPKAEDAPVEKKGVLVELPTTILKLVDNKVKEEDTDRAKWIRKAIREKLAAS